MLLVAFGGKDGADVVGLLLTMMLLISIACRRSSSEPCQSSSTPHSQAPLPSPLLSSLALTPAVPKPGKSSPCTNQEPKASFPSLVPSLSPFPLDVPLLPATISVRFPFALPYALPLINQRLFLCLDLHREATQASELQDEPQNWMSSAHWRSRGKRRGRRVGEGLGVKLARGRGKRGR